MKLLVLALTLAGCGAVAPEMRLRRDGSWVDTYGWACTCGAKTLEVLRRPAAGAYRVRCPDCHREWLVSAESR